MLSGARPDFGFILPVPRVDVEGKRHSQSLRPSPDNTREATLSVIGTDLQMGLDVVGGVKIAS